MGRGRDAADVAMSTALAVANLPFDSARSRYSNSAPCRPDCVRHHRAPHAKWFFGPNR